MWDECILRAREKDVVLVTVHPKVLKRSICTLQGSSFEWAAAWRTCALFHDIDDIEISVKSQIPKEHGQLKHVHAHAQMDLQRTPSFYVQTCSDVSASYRPSRL